MKNVISGRNIQGNAITMTKSRVVQRNMASGDKKHTVGLAAGAIIYSATVPAGYIYSNRLID